jgi:site-specific recombinase XerD
MYSPQLLSLLNLTNSGDSAPRVLRPLRRRLVRTTLGAGPSRPDADASDERIVELWLRDRPANTRVAYERDYGRFRAFIGPRSLRTIGLGDLSDFAATLTGSAATRRRTLSAIKALLTTGFKMGALRFNVGAALRLPKVVSRRAERRLEEIELFLLLTAVEKKPRDRAIIEALYGTGARVDELVQLRRRQLVADIEGLGGYVTLYGKHGGRTIRVGRRTWDALQFLADGKEPDERIIAITDERIRQILTAAAGLQKKLSPHWLRHAHGSHAHQRGAPAATIRDTLGHASLSTTDLYLSSAPTDGSNLYLKF